MEYGVSGTRRPIAQLDAENAAAIATTLQALAVPSRLLILAQLRDGPLKVTALAAAIGMKQPLVSQHLGLLRTAGLVTGTRHGRSVLYRLTDDQVGELLDDITYHSEHFQTYATEWSDTTTPPPEPTTP